MRIKEITETVSGGIAGTIAPMNIGSKKRAKKIVKQEDAIIGGKISNTNKRYGPAKGPKFTAGAGMKNDNYPPNKS
tara:strand:- start:1213 stop:1440 length:228 start_codon:yes stop_codon:yes gene_type:complete